MTEALSPQNTSAASDCSPASEVEKAICFVKARRRYGESMYNDGFVLLAVGEVVTHEMSMQGNGLEDWLINDPTPDGITGILVWEGTCENKWNMHNGCEWEPRLQGKWRRPTAHELWSLAGVEPASS